MKNHRLFNPFPSPQIKSETQWLRLRLRLDPELLLKLSGTFLKALKQFQKDEPWPRSPLRSLQFSAGNKYLGLIIFLSKAA